MGPKSAVVRAAKEAYEVARDSNQVYLRVAYSSWIRTVQYWG